MQFFFKVNSRLPIRKTLKFTLTQLESYHKFIGLKVVRFLSKLLNVSLQKRSE